MRPRDILRTAHEQACRLGAPEGMRERLLMSAQHAETNNDQLPPWLPFAPNAKQSNLTVIREEETP